MSRRQNSLMRFSRTERLAQLSEQEIVIERKKKEILAKLEAQKKKVSEVFRKSEPTEELNSNKSKNSENLLQNRDECQRGKNKEKLADKTKSERLTNAFSNDGSFLDQFKKLTKSNSAQNTSEVKSLNLKEENMRSEGNTKTVKDAYKSLGVNSHSLFLRKPLDSSIQLPLSPPQVVQLTTNQASQLAPLNHNSVSVLPVSVQVQPSQNAVQPVKFSSASKQIPPVQVSDYGLGQERKNIGGGLPSFSSSVSAFSYSAKSSFKSSQNIPVTSKKSELPKIRSESISMTLKNNSVKRLEAIPNPLDVDDEEISPPTKKSQFVFSEKKENCKEGGGNILKNSDSQLPMRNTHTHGDSSNVSSALTKGKKNEKEDGDYSQEMLHKWGKLVAQYGDDFEDILKERNDSDLRFLKKKDSNVYLTYRDLVLKYRSNFNTHSRETSGKQTDKSPIFNSLQCEAEDLDDKIEFSKQRPVDLGETKKALNYSTDPEAGSVSENTAAPLTDKEETLSYYKMPESGAEKDGFLPFQKQVYQEEAQNENSNESVAEISEQAKTEERRKRKRKSRWGDAVASASTSATEANLNLPTLGKLPTPKSTLLSQLTRSDPGLIQYARQTFGSTNLSEEDWKKAEDHYKINLLYQDMVRKRAEVEKLERQGKFKYEYDSDEDTEGGTWEHKLRQQEMQATQLWAEELTRQAAGKHHIGDFLPPEELERFMEKYNAVKQGREPDLSDYKEFKLKEDNVGYRLLQKMGWNEGQGLGQDGTGITNPVNKAITRHENQGLGVERPDGLEAGDDEYDAYRKRMMLAYRFRPNPLNNPRRPYY